MMVLRDLIKTLYCWNKPRWIEATCLVGLSLLLCVLSGCKDELELVEEGSDEIVKVEGDCIAFTMQLNHDLSSRTENDMFSSINGSYLDKYENYIDTQDKFRVFFFTENGDFLFGATDRVVGSPANTTDNTFWYVRIPMTMLVDRDNQEYDVEKIKSYLKNHPFKIAVLANWPNGGEKINPADWDDSEGTPDGGDNPSSTLKGHPRWNWSNSILNRNAKPGDIRNINDLHHVYNDGYYAAASRLGTYEKFMAHVIDGQEPGYYMGEPTDWVKMRDINDNGGWHNTYDLSTEVSSFNSKATANQWIRANCTPDETLNQKKKIYRHYQHLWFLWNFDASFKYGEWLENQTTPPTALEETNRAKLFYGNNWDWDDASPAEVTNPWGVKWFERNGRRLYSWMKENYRGEISSLDELLIDIGESNNDVFFHYNPKQSYPAYCRYIGGNYGIQLPNIGDAQITTNIDGLLTFQARTSGTLRVKWSSYDGTPSGLGVQVGNNYRKQKDVTDTAPRDWTYDNLNYLDISVEGNSEPVYIFCNQGKAVVYSIEFIRGRYLYETDREGVMPSEQQGIPMYGVQDYPAIPDWQRGTTHNLNKNISLIRALAKVEVYIQKSFGEPRHVYMRNMNRAARCEPMDVHTSTDNLWLSDNHSAKDEYGNYLCEWFRIQQYGASYGIAGNYNNWLSWFYGSWQYNDKDKEPIQWKTEGENVNYVWNYDKGYWVPDGVQKGWAKSSSLDCSTYYPSDMNDKTPPHLFNPYYYRSDFCRFIKDNEEGNYYKYVLFLPEKNIDDPSVVGQMTSDPRVPHIEYRFDPPAYSMATDEPDAVAEEFSNTEYNLDDNDCFRIYFTNYGYGGENDNIKDNTPINRELHDKRWTNATYDMYERNRERLNKHWPIMRNHKYKFFVEGSGPENLEIRVEVSDWSHRKVVVTW